MLKGILLYSLFVLLRNSNCLPDPTRKGPYDVKIESIEIDGFVTSFGLIQDAIVFYPSSGSTK